MEKVQPGFLRRINPRNFNFITKIIFLTLGIILLIMLLYYVLGFNTLSNTLIKNTTSQLEELTYSKASELELVLHNTQEKFIVIAAKEPLKMAAEELITSFASLPEDKYELFFDNQVKELKNDLENYYTKAVAQYAPISSENVIDYFPSDPKTIVSQFLYVMGNPKSLGEKEEFNKYEDYSSYTQSHNSHHPYLSDLRKKMNANDLYLVDPKSGYVVYSTQKSVDFGVNLYEGVLKNSKLSEAFRVAVSLGQNETFMSDFENYMPAGDKPIAFLSIPLYSFDQLKGILIVQLGTDIFDASLFDDAYLSGETTLEYTIIGSDLKLRNNPKPFLTNKEGFLEKYIRLKGRKASDKIIRFSKIENMAILTQYSVEYKDLLYSESTVRVKDYIGNDVLASSKKIKINNKDELLLVTKIDQKEVLNPYRNQLGLYLILAMIILFMSYIIVYTFGNSFTKRLKSLLDGIMLLHNGERVKDLQDKSKDELGDTIEAYNRLRRRVNNAEEFALELSEGNFNYNFRILSDRDSLGKSLNVLKDRLVKSREEHEARAKEDEIRNWINDGVAKFNDLLRENTTDIKLLGYSLIENLISYLDASVGGIFLVEGDHESDKRIELLASYAYDRRKYHEKSIEIGEGLLGASYLEKKSIYLKKIPDDYIEITSGLGHEIPACLYIAPLKVDEDVMGMIEVASFNEFSSHQIEFIDRVADSIAATFVSVRLNMKTAALLEESNRKAEEIAQGEEEMRQNLEEMQATQEELARLRQDDEKRTREMQLVIDNTRRLLKNMLDNIPGGYILKDQNGIIHLANKEGAKYYGLSPDRVVGKTDHELLGSKLYQAEHKKDLEVLDKGEKEYSEEQEIKGKKIKYKVVKKPFEIAEISQTGVLTMRFKI